MQPLHHTVDPRTVVVVGAGPSGLTVARELERAGHGVTVLEEQDTVAGKCQSVTVDGRAFDLGGHGTGVAVLDAVKTQHHRPVRFEGGPELVFEFARRRHGHSGERR